IPGAPLPVEAYNDHIGWTFTNTGSDQIDHYFLRLDSTSSRYWFDGGWRDLDLVVDTIFVKGDRPIVDTLRYAHWGPVIMQGREAIALRWVAHDSSRTLQALLGMNRAADHEEFQSALRQWDTPMQNVLFADVKGNISVRSTGYMPIRRGGHGKGLLDGSTDSSDWIGRIPFDSLPHAVNPPQGFLTSTNQKPTDSTYPYYLDHDWRIGYRSIRIDSILRSKERHTVEDLKSYQADVGAVQRDFLVGFLDTLSGVTERADSLRRMLRAWNGQMTVDRREPLLVDFLMQELERLTWDEPEFTPAYDVGAAGDTLSGPFRVPRPGESRIFKLLAEYPSSKWLDVQSTAVREDAAGLLRLVLDSAADRYDQAVGIGSLWGDHRKIRFNFIIDNESFSALGRGPFEYSGYEETLSPAKDSITTHSASTRLVVDFSQSPPRGSIVYPGGQSGNPFSRRYDLHLPVYLGFMHYDPLKPASASEFQDAAASHRSILQPR
ncbi:MAG: penicillin acylase family protein, partial [Rhodothermales bacterium]